MPNGFGVSALEAAERNGHAEVAELLLQHGANPTEPTKESLLIAVEAGNRRGVEAALDRGVTPDVYTEGGEPVLTVAVRQRQYEIADVLLRSKAKVDAKDRDKKTALMRAAELGATDMIRLLLEAGANLEETDPKGSTPLLLAVWNGQAKAAQLLIEMGANTDVQDLSGRSLQMIAQHQGHPEILKLLKASGLAEKSLEADLLAAAARGDHAKVATLIAAEANPELPDEAGNTPVALAAARGWNEAEFIHSVQNGDSVNTQALLEEGVDVNIRDLNGSTALFIACQRDHWQAFDILLEHDASVNVRNYDDRTPLMEAAKQIQNSLKLVEAMYQADPNLDLNAQDKNGETALLEAARAGMPETILFLVEKGANVNTVNRRGAAPIIEMAKHPYVDAVDALLKHGANACARDADYNTAILEAARQGHVPILKNLLEHLKERLKVEHRKRKAVINAIDQKSCTALDWAMQGGFKACVSLLQEHGGLVAAATNFMVIVTIHGTHYHQKDCWPIRNANKNDPIALRDAIRWNYEMCEVCKPSLQIIDWNC